MKRTLLLALALLLGFAAGGAEAALRETPFFAKEVKSGKLPPVAERIPSQPALAEAGAQAGFGLLQFDALVLGVVFGLFKGVFGVLQVHLARSEPFACGLELSVVLQRRLDGVQAVLDLVKPAIDLLETV